MVKVRVSTATYVPPLAVVAACQFAPKLMDVNGNLGIARQLAFEAAAKGAKVIVLPEMCTSGYVLRSQREAASVAQTCDGYQTEAFVPIARRFGCHIVFGYVELCEGKFYNSAAVVGPNGLEGNFQKHNGYGSDFLWFTPSEQVPPVVLTHAGRLGVLICRDVMNEYRQSYRFNHEQQFYTESSVDCVALLTNWGNSYGFPDASWVELAEKLDTNVIVSNRTGKERDMKWKGGSCVIDRTLAVHSYGSSFIGEAVVGGVVIL